MDPLTSGTLYTVGRRPGRSGADDAQGRASSSPLRPVVAYFQQTRPPQSTPAASSAAAFHRGRMRGTAPRIPVHDGNRGGRSALRRPSMGAFYASRPQPAIAERLDGVHATWPCCAKATHCSTARRSYLFDRLESRRIRSDDRPRRHRHERLLDSGARLPMVHGDDVLTVLPGTLDEAHIGRAPVLAATPSVIMKLGRNLPKIQRRRHGAPASTGRAAVRRARHHVSRAGAAAGRVGARRPGAVLLALVLIPGRQRAR